MQDMDMDLIDLYELEDHSAQHGHVSKKVSLVMKKLMLTRERKPSKGKLINLMTKTNVGLKQGIKDVKSVGNCMKDVAQFNTISDLITEMDNVENELKTEREYLADLQNKLQRKTSGIVLLQKQKSKEDKKWVSNMPQKRSDSDKFRNALKEKLHVANVQLSNELTTNAELRDKIQALMSERTVFNKEYDRLLHKLKHGKQVMEGLKMSLQSSVNSKKNIQKKLEKLNIKEMKQRAMQEEETNDLVERKANETKFKSHFDIKLQTRQIIPTAQQRKRSKQTDSLVRERLQQEFMTLNKGIIDIFGVTSDEDNSNFEEVARRITLGDSDVVSLLAYLTQLNYEREALKEKVLNQEIELKEKMLIQDEKEDQQEEHLEHLKIIKNEITEAYLSLVYELEASKRSLNKLWEGITNLTNVTKTNVSPLLKLLGENNNVNEFNYKLFLESLETTIISLMQKIIPDPEVSMKKMHAVSWTKSISEDPFVIPGIPALTLTSPCSICFPTIKKIIL